MNSAVSRISGRSKHAKTTTQRPQHTYVAGNMATPPPQQCACASSASALAHCMAVAHCTAVPHYLCLLPRGRKVGVAGWEIQESGLHAF